MTRLFLAAALSVALPFAAAPVDSTLPNRADTLKFAVIGDNGTGEKPQFELAAEMATTRGRFAYSLVLMLGDNFYGRQRADDLREKFNRPYQPLLDAGVRFQAAIGNHDDPSTVSYPPLNMEGRRYYTFAENGVRFFVLDTNDLNTRQLAWFTDALAASTEPWRIAYFHHPIYGNGGRHGGSAEIRVVLEPLFQRYGISVVFAGHDHVYERLVPQSGITYFVCGSGGQLRKGGLEPSTTTAAGYDDDRAFLVAEVDGDSLFFEAISRTGKVVDNGVIRRRGPSGS